MGGNSSGKIKWVGAKFDCRYFKEKCLRIQGVSYYIQEMRIGLLLLAVGKKKICETPCICIQGKGPR